MGTQLLHGCLTGWYIFVCALQETELSLQRLATGLKELATMKTDLSQYVAATDSALLEQQLEQLSGQWEELCMKVRADKGKLIKDFTIKMKGHRMNQKK